MVRRTGNVTGGHFVSWTKQLNEKGLCTCNSKDCNFTTTDVKEMAVHYRDCLLQSEGRYRCMLCSFTGLDYNVVVAHVKNSHLKKGKQGGDFEDSGSEADVGKESSDSDGTSGVDETETDHHDDEDAGLTTVIRQSTNKHDTSTAEIGPDRLGTGSNSIYRFFIKYLTFFLSFNKIC